MATFGSSGSIKGFCQQVWFSVYCVALDSRQTDIRFWFFWAVIRPAPYRVGILFLLGHNVSNTLCWNMICLRPTLVGINQLLANSYDPQFLWLKIRFRNQPVKNNRLVNETELLSWRRWIVCIQNIQDPQILWLKHIQNSEIVSIFPRCFQMLVFKSCWILFDFSKHNTNTWA